MRTFHLPTVTQTVVSDCKFTNDSNKHRGGEVYECREYTRQDDPQWNSAAVLCPSVRSFENKLMSDNKLLNSNRMAGLFTKEPWTVAWLEETLQPDHVFWDIGGCQGVYTVYSSVLGCKSVRSFEPVTQNFLDLQCNVKVNGIDNVNLHHMAITDKTGFVEWNYPLTSGVGGSQEHLLGHTLNSNSISHSIYNSTMDSLVFEHGFEQPDIIKVDTDGTDPQRIVDGALKVLENVTSILIEIFGDPWDLKFHHQLLDLGFELDMEFYDGIREARQSRSHPMLRKCVELIYRK